jgi:hypothetical protein
MFPQHVELSWPAQVEQHVERALTDHLVRKRDLAVPRISRNWRIPHSGITA